MNAIKFTVLPAAYGNYWILALKKVFFLRRNVLALFFMSGEPYVTKYHSNEKDQTSDAACLSLIVGQSAFMFASFTRGFKKVIELCHVEMKHISDSTELSDRISFLIHNYLLHQKKFEKVYVALVGSEFTMVPEVYAQSGGIKTMLQFATGAKQVTGSMQHSFKNLAFCYSESQQLISQIEKIFPNASIRHHGALTLSLMFSQHSLVNSDLYLNIGDGFIELAAKKRNDVLFYNFFKCATNEDILYYILFMMEQFNLDPVHTKLTIAGQKDPDDEIVKSIKRYIRQVNFCVLSPEVELGASFRSLPGHYYFTLLNQQLCEL